MSEPMTFTVPLIGHTPETQLVSALEAVVSMWLASQCLGQSMPFYDCPEQMDSAKRAVNWLNAKYGS